MEWLDGDRTKGTMWKKIDIRDKGGWFTIKIFNS